jgi:hypothetical protein
VDVEDAGRGGHQFLAALRVVAGAPKSHARLMEELRDDGAGEGVERSRKFPVAAQTPDGALDLFSGDGRGAGPNRRDDGSGPALGKFPGETGDLLVDDPLGILDGARTRLLRP